MAWGLLFAMVSAPTGHAEIQGVVAIQLNTQNLNLGTMSPSIEDHNAAATLEVMVFANMPHGGVIATLTPLEHPQGAQIAPQRVRIRRVGTTTYTNLGDAVNLTGALPAGLFQFTFQFQVGSSWADVPGEYSGELTLTYGVAP